MLSIEAERPEPLLLLGAPPDGRQPQGLEKKDDAPLMIEAKPETLLLTAPPQPPRLEYAAPLLIEQQRQASKTRTKKAQDPANTEAPLMLTNKPENSETDIPQKKTAAEILWEELQKEQKLSADRQKVATAYADFFNHISLRRGWKTAPFTHQAIAPLLWKAATVVAKVRYDLDSAKPGFKIRMVDGSAREYMWTVKEDPSQDEGLSNEFVKQVVHATFRDGSGYVEGLTAQRIDQEIQEILLKTA